VPWSCRRCFWHSQRAHSRAELRPGRSSRDRHCPQPGTRPSRWTSTKGRARRNCSRPVARSAIRALLGSPEAAGKANWPIFCVSTTPRAPSMRGCLRTFWQPPAAARLRSLRHRGRLRSSGRQRRSAGEALMTIASRRRRPGHPSPPAGASRRSRPQGLRRLRRQRPKRVRRNPNPPPNRAHPPVRRRSRTSRRRPKSRFEA
jgi:hypothetical protein